MNEQLAAIERELDKIPEAPRNMKSEDMIKLSISVMRTTLHMIVKYLKNQDSQK